MATYEFQFDPRFARYLSVLGVRPDTASVTVEDGRLVARFGPWVCETTTGNVDGSAFSAGELLARAKQVVHALRELGLQKGDTVAAVLPNGVKPMWVYLGAVQAGYYYIPVN